jgi:hypothetical protein
MPDRKGNRRGIYLVRTIGIMAICAMLPCGFLRAQDVSAEQVRSSSALKISLDGLLNLVGRAGGDDSAQAMAIGLIEIYGLGFRPTHEDIEKLKAASATEALLKAIEAAKIPPLPPPKYGMLAVSCEPVDCDVILNGRPAGSTSHGHLPWISLSEGPAAVSVTKANYDVTEAKRDVVIRPNELTQMEFQLRISEAGLAELGAKRFQLMRQAVRGHSAVTAKEASAWPSSGIEGDQLRAAGTLYLHGPDGRCAVWSVVAWFQREHAARFELSRLREKYVLTSAGRGFSWNRNLRGDDAREVEEGMRIIGESQLPALMERLADPGLIITAPDPGREDRAAFRAESKLQNYVVALDSANRPSEILIEPAGESPSRRILYSDYAELAGSLYPKTMQIVLPDGASGIEARFDTVQIGAMPESRPKNRRGLLR